MIKKIDHNNMGRSNLGWLNSWFHFSFAEYYDPMNMHYGQLRVVNDDMIQSHTGFDTHSHRDMEIVTYVIQGELTHGDSMQNTSVLCRGDFQYMSAGSGIFHSEKNEGEDILRLLQIWILPDKNGYTPQYGEKKIPWKERENKLLPVVSANNEAAIQIHQDIQIYVSTLDHEKALDIPVEANRQVYLIVIEGSASIHGVHFNEKDAAKIDETFTIKAEPEAHVIIFDMKKDKFEEGIND